MLLNSPWMAAGIFSLLLIGLLLLYHTSRRRKVLGLPAGRIISSDTNQWTPVEHALYDAVSGLAGRPDYLIEQAGKLIPVEVKSHPVGSGPYDAHIYQLAAYCLLVERSFQKRPPYGILHYPNRTYAIDFSPRLETELLDLLIQIHKKEKSRELDRSHSSPGRCQGCGFRSSCNQRLL
jgi:CRISPR-associated exonuclease Cas4